MLQLKLHGININEWDSDYWTEVVLLDDKHPDRTLDNALLIDEEGMRDLMADLVEDFVECSLTLKKYDGGFWAELHIDDDLDVYAAPTVLRILLEVDENLNPCDKLKGLYSPTTTTTIQST